MPHPILPIVYSDLSVSPKLNESKADLRVKSAYFLNQGHHLVCMSRLSAATLVRELAISGHSPFIF